MRRARTAGSDEVGTARTPLDPPLAGLASDTSDTGAAAASRADAETTPRATAPPRAESTRAGAGHPRARRTKLYVEAILLVALVVLVVLLALDNRDQARVGWVVGDTTASVVWIVLAAAILGWLAGIVTSFVFRRRTRAES